MASVGSLTSQSLDPGRDFNWIFLVELLVCGVLTLFFLFYFNRLFATLVSYGFRAYTWHKYRVYIDIQALQVSLLGGRIFFKGIRYHGENETFLLQNGYITWNYWLRAVKQADCARFSKGDHQPSASSNQESRSTSPSSGTEPNAKESGAVKAAQDLPSRISVSVSGFEWFIYNRSPAYEAIAASQARQARQNVALRSSEGHQSRVTSEKMQKECSEGDVLVTEQVGQVLTRPSTCSTSGDYAIPTTDDGILSNQSTQQHGLGNARTFTSLETRETNLSSPDSRHDVSPMASTWLLTLFPILIECQKGAIVIGNEHTRTIVTTSFEKSRGHIDAAKSGPQDIYRQIFEFEVTHPVVQMKPNPDYRQSQQGAAQNIIYKVPSTHEETSWWNFNWRFHRRRRRMLHSMRTLVPYFRSSVESFRPSSTDGKNNVGKGNWPNEVPGESRWLGLSRYLDDNERDDHEGWSNVEYARFSNIVDCPSVHLSLYWDVPGIVQLDPASARTTNGEEDINLAKPPSYGLDMIFRGGNVNYGPWADRARAEIQNVFFPNSYQDAIPADALPVGALRQNTSLSVNIHIENDTTLRIPCKENSKDWQWKGRAGALRGVSAIRQQRDKKNMRRRNDNKNKLGPDVRPFGWFAVTVSSNSTITYNMDMVAGKKGYHNDLQLDLKGTNMTTSVNHALLWRCGSQKISCDLSNPLGWNALHKWAVDVQSHSMELFLLRDHIFLLVDLISDFNSGPPGDFLTFVPFIYQMKLSFVDIKLYLNANDSNIIDNPCDVDENTFLMLHGETLDVSIDIPLEDYAPFVNQVDFRAKAKNARLDLATPTWNTAHTFASDMSTATLEDFCMGGSYNYYSNTSPDLTDSLFLDLSGFSPRIFLTGSLIRYCMKLKDNYFGDDIHFRTLEEYQEFIFKQKDVEVEPTLFQNKKDNDLDVILKVTFDRVCALLPANIYSRKENLRLEFLLIETDVRFTNYYMDLEAKFSPIEAAWESVKAEEVRMDDYVSKTEAFVDGISIYGHRLFGAPPSEPTYVCNWDFDVGKATGECSTKFVRIFLQAIKSFAFTFDDGENALPPSHIPLIHDVTFLRASVDSVYLWFLLDDIAILFATGHLEISFNDWAVRNFSDRLQVGIPDIQLAAVDQKTATRKKGQKGFLVPTHAVFQLSLMLQMVERKREFDHERELQQQHVNFHDQRTHRTGWLLHDTTLRGQPHVQLRRPKPNPPAMPIPHMPVPLSKEHHTLSSLQNSRALNQGKTSTSRLGRRTSFFTKPSSCSPSIRSGKNLSKVALDHADQRRQLQFLGSLPGTRIEINEDSATTPSATDTKRYSATDGKMFPDSKSRVKYSSPWSAPYFALEKIALDTNNLPDKPRNASLPKRNKKWREDTLTTSVHVDEDSTDAHTMIDINLGSCVRGFASPTFFSAISTLMKALQPVEPTDLLDALQIGTISQLRKLGDVLTEFRQTTDFCFRMPFAHLRIENSDPPWQPLSDHTSHDWYDLQLTELKVTARSGTNEKRSNHPRSSENAIRLHAVLGKGLLEVYDRSSDVLCDKPAARVSLEDLILWVASDERTIARFQQRDVEVTSWGSRIEYLASLIQRSIDLAGHIIDQLSDMDSATRYQSLVYHLADVAGASTDPVFLTRPSYVLRTADGHLRLNDSWKIASRLRYMLLSLDSHQQATLAQHCTNPDASLPSNAEALVLKGFDSWRSWDLAHVRKSLIMETVWPLAKLSGDVDPRNGVILLELAIENVRFLLDPGPKENQAGIHDINTIISIIDTASKDAGRTNGDVSTSRSFIVQSHCSRFGVHLNWELLELISDTAELFIARKEKSGPSLLHKPKVEQLPRSRQVIHVIFGMDGGVITLDSINITLAMAASGFRGSVLHRIDTEDIETISVLLTCQSASTRLKDQERVVLAWLLDNSTVSLSQTSPIHRTAGPIIMKATGKCETLRFEMRENMGDSLHIANRMMGDEIRILKSLASRLSTGSQSVQKEEPSYPQQRRDLYMALFLDQYSLNFAMTPLLTYVISGEVTRTSVVPISSTKVGINLDLKTHRHNLKLKGNSRGSPVAMLDVPPINGRVTVSRLMESTQFKVDTTIDKVELDARSVRSCVDTINQPEVIRALIDSRKSAQQLSSQVNALLSPPPGVVVETSKHSAAFLYAANVTLIGLRVHASAPALKSKDYHADLDFVLGLTTVNLGNQGVKEGVLHADPQFDINFQRISLNVYRRSNGDITKSGNIDFSGQVTGKTETDNKKNEIRTYHAASDGFDVSLSAETASLVVDVAAHLQERIKSFTLADEVKRLKPLRRLTMAGFAEPPTITVTNDDDKGEEETAPSNLFDSIYSLALNNITVAWKLDASLATSPSRQVEDLVFSIQKISLNTKREGSATLAIADLQLQMVPQSLEAKHSSLNSALMPEVVFKAAYLSTKKDRRFAFQAAGKALDLRLASDFIVPVTALRASLAGAIADLREGSAMWAEGPASSKKESNSLFGSKYLASLLIDADFAGAVVNIQARRNEEERKSVFGILKGDKRSRAGRYDQVVQGDGAIQATLRAPGVAMKIEYAGNPQDDPALNAEIKVAASSNVLYPSVVPLIIEVSSSVKEIVGKSDDTDRNEMNRTKSEIQKPPTDSPLASSNPANIMGRCKLNLGMWIREQDFSLSCQPIARVAATARFNNIFIAVKTVQSADEERFFALSATFNGLQASVQHVYSRESTASLEVDSIVLSMMNSKHVSNTTGVSAILNVSPMKASVNAKQLQDFLLFREIWYPAELRHASSAPTTASAAADNQSIVVQRYQQVAAAGAFPWNAVVSIQELIVQLDLGQSLGKSSFTVSKLWVSSKKASDFEQNLCLGFEKVGVDSTGRMSGFVELHNLRVRTSIRWPRSKIALEQTPLVQASLGVDEVRVKAAFDYQPFAIAQISKFEFLMYNVRPGQSDEKDRLVGNLEGDKVQVFCTTASASQALALYQAVVRLIQERDVAYEASLRELDRYLRRKSVFPSSTWTATSTEMTDGDIDILHGPVSLHTDVVVTLKAVNVGAFPSTFYDNQIFKVEATDAQARFAVSAEDGKTQSSLALTLGQLRVALSTVNRANTQALGEVSVNDVVSRATSSRGGTILKVPKVVASMQTWQQASSNSIDYIFKSTFEGKVDVGWNYSRISFIRGMWSTHSRALAARLGKPLPQSAVQITGGPQPDDDDGKGNGQDKITAVVNVPQSRFEYRALEPPIIDTPQLRDMGEATPPLEWIGLHRDKLPNVTHQVIIVTLLGVAKEVEDAYTKILGSS